MNIGSPYRAPLVALMTNNGSILLGAVCLLQLLDKAIGNALHVVQPGLSGWMVISLSCDEKNAVN